MKSGQYDRNSIKRPTANFSQEEEGLRIDGLQQIIDLLKHADAPFRDSLLQRISKKDPQITLAIKRRLLSEDRR